MHSRFRSRLPYRILIFIGLAGHLAGSRLHAGPLVLYDGTQQAVTPNNFSPQWLSFFSLGGAQSYSGVTSATNYNSAASNAVQGGYSNYLGSTLVNSQFPQLDRSAGYRLSFSVEILAESHTANERSGFSVIAVGGDVASGVAASIELGFQANRVFAQNDNPLFGSPAADSSAFNPVGAGFVNYELTVQGSTYVLAANQQTILSGLLRDYTAFSGVPDVYELPNFLFLGDNTTSASGNINLRSLTLDTFSPVPEPSSLAGLSLVLAGMAVRRFRR